MRQYAVRTASTVISSVNTADACSILTLVNNSASVNAITVRLAKGLTKFLTPDSESLQKKKNPSTAMLSQTGYAKCLNFRLLYDSQSPLKAT
jgi:hypothetical protein